MKKNLVKKAVLPALVALLCSVVALTSVSYAWFTMGNSGSVESIDVTVKAADGMQLSTDALNWKSDIDLDDFTGTNAIFPTGAIMPVSTDGTINNGALKLFEGKLDTDGSTLLAKSHDKSTGNYVMFDLYVKVENDKQLQLAPGSDVTNVVAEGFKESQVHYATRVAFVDLGSKATAGEAKALDGTGVEGKAVIWEPNADAHTNQAIYQNPTMNLDGDGKIVQTYEGISGREADEKEYEKATKANVTPTIRTNAGKGVETVQNVIELEAGVNKVRVYIWLEGQDVDCLNDVSKSMFETTLKFSIPQ